MKHRPSISDSLITAEWEDLAHVLRNVSFSIEGNGPEARKLRAQLGIVKMLIHGDLLRWNGNHEIELAYLVGALKLVKKLEHEFEAKNVKKKEFLIFLQLLVEKFKRQKIKAKKRMAVLVELERMKGVVESGNNIV